MPPKKGGGKGKGKQKEDPVEASRRAIEERAEHERQIKQLHGELREQLVLVDAAENRLRDARADLEHQRADHEDINTYLERQLQEKKKLVEDMQEKFNEQQEMRLRRRAELRYGLDFEEQSAESRRERNRKQLENNEQALAFMPEYTNLLERNATADEAYTQLEARLEAASAELALKQTWASIIAACKTGSDEAGLGGMPCLLIEAMRAFPDHAFLQEQALTMLAALLAADEADNARMIHRSGGVPAIVRALSEHGPHSRALATHACGLLWGLAVASAAVCNDLAENDVLPLVIRTLREHTASSRLCYNACGAIAYLLVTRPQQFTVASQIESLPPIDRAAVQAHPALTRRTKPPPSDPAELRRQMELLRLQTGAGVRASMRQSQSITVGGTKLTGSAAWHRELLVAAISKHTRKERSELPIAPARELSLSPRGRTAAGVRTGGKLADAVLSSLGDPGEYGGGGGGGGGGGAPSPARRAGQSISRASMDSSFLDFPDGPVDTTERLKVAPEALDALLEAVRRHPAEAKAVEYALCAVWNVLLHAPPDVAREFVTDSSLDGLGLVLEMMRTHARVAGVLLYSVAILLIAVDVPGGAEQLLVAKAAPLAQEVARAHPHNERLQEGVVELDDALTHAHLQPLADRGAPPDGWSAATHAHWLQLSAHLHEVFADMSPDKTALYRALHALHGGYHRLAQIFRYYASSGGTAETSIDAYSLDVREWNTLAKTCKLATRSYDRTQINRVFLETSATPKDGLTEHVLDFSGFIEALVRVAFERLNPFYTAWLLGTASSDVGMVPIDEAVTHLLQENIFPLSDAPEMDVALRLVKNEQVDIIVAQHRPTLFKLFKKFAFRTASAIEVVRQADFVSMARQANIIAPGKGGLTAREAKAAFAESQSDKANAVAMDDGEGGGVETTTADFDEFVECLCRCAVARYVSSGTEPLLVNEAAGLISNIFAQLNRGLQNAIFKASIAPGPPGGAQPASRMTGVSASEVAAAAAATAAGAAAAPPQQTTTTVRLVPVPVGQAGALGASAAGAASAMPKPQQQTVSAVGGAL